MPGDTDIASIAALLADPTRAAMLLALSDGRAFTASELAKSARVAPSTASEHLGRLVEAELLAVVKQGAIASTSWLIPPLSKSWKGSPAWLRR